MATGTSLGMCLHKRGCQETPTRWQQKPGDRCWEGTGPLRATMASARPPACPPKKRGRFYSCLEWTGRVTRDGGRRAWAQCPQQCTPTARTRRPGPALGHPRGCGGPLWDFGGRTGLVPTPACPLVSPLSLDKASSLRASVFSAGRVLAHAQCRAAWAPPSRPRTPSINPKGHPSPLQSPSPPASPSPWRRQPDDSVDWSVLDIPHRAHGILQPVAVTEHVFGFTASRARAAGCLPVPQPMEPSRFRLWPSCTMLPCTPGHKLLCECTFLPLSGDAQA